MNTETPQPSSHHHRTPKQLDRFDFLFISFFRKYADECARGALFVIFFWFGILKVLALSPAGPLVINLLNVTFLRHFITPDQFLVIFGALEVILGIMILIPKLERITFALIGFHLVTTVMPLFLLPDITWDAFLVPSLIGQYIIKNIALLSLGLFLFARLKPMTETHSVMGEEEEATM